MTTINGELLDYTKRAIDDIYVSGNCCARVTINTIVALFLFEIE